VSRFGRHFVRVRELKAFERRLIKLLVERPGALHLRHEALFRYALALGQTNLLRNPEGRDIQLSEDVDDLRAWMLEHVAPLIPEGSEPKIDLLRQIAPLLAIRTDVTRTNVLTQYSNEFGPEHLDDEMRNKKLTLVLGGGGGSGLVHLGVFSMLNEMGVVPELIVGSSMGSILGLLRAIDKSYDPVNTVLALPRHIDFNSVFSPFTGYSRYGFPGAFHLNLLRVGREIFQSLVGTSMPRFSELPIKLEIVVCGIRKGFQLDTARYEQVARDDPGMNPSSMRKKLGLFFTAVRDLTKNPRLLSQVVFGRDELTKDFPVLEAMGFSCSVPGLLHYDIFHDDPETLQSLDSLFEQEQLLRLCDGGVVNNVPSQVAWDSVQSGTLGSRNSYILAIDAFAPVTRGANMIWIPIQQIARPTVLANRPYSDYHKTFKHTPSPLQIVLTSYSKLKVVLDNAREQLQADEPYIRRALEPLPPYGTWEIGEH